MRRLSVILAAALLTGCATCREHPAVCTAAAAFVVGSVAIVAEQHRHHDVAARPINADPCVEYYLSRGFNLSESMTACR